MATTAKGTPYVESSDLVANYPAVSLALAEHIDDFGGKVLQVVRAIDTTQRTTTSTTYVDVTGMSVTITPQKSTSAILLIWTGYGSHGVTSDFIVLRLTDNSNNPIEGAQDVFLGSNTTQSFVAPFVVVGYNTPATTSATTYKARFRVSSSGTAQIENQFTTGQLYAIEVSA